MFLLSTRNSQNTFSYLQSLDILNNFQCAYLKDLLLDTKVSLLNLTEPFNLLNTKTIPDYRLLDNFTNCISFHYCNCSSFSNHKFYLEFLNYLYLKTFSFSSTLIIVTNTSAILSGNIQVISATYF